MDNINLPESVKHHIFRFMSHPASDAIRSRIDEYQAFCNLHQSDDRHTFYIFFFLDGKIRSIINTLDNLYEQTGINVGVDDSYFKPSLWRLYENQYPGYFGRKALVNSRTIINLNWQNIFLIKQYIEFMSKVNKLTTSFIKITNALDKGRNQDEYNIYVSMLDEEELECLKYVQRLRKYTNKQTAVVVVDDDATKLQPKKRGRKKKNANDNGTSNEEASVDSTLPPSPA